MGASASPILLRDRSVPGRMVDPKEKDRGRAVTLELQGLVGGAQARTASAEMAAEPAETVETFKRGV